MLWVTRSHVHVDRVACPWLIARFIDSDAEFLFVPASSIAETVKKTGAMPFDTPDAELGHKAGKCSFETIVAHYGIKDRALQLLATIVGCADTDRLADHPAAAGLEALAVGYSLRYPDDHANLAKQFDVYDSLYAWCRLEVASHQG